MLDLNIIRKSIDESVEKCGKPKYIQSLPGDLRTTDQNVLNERLNAIQKLEDETQKEYDKKYSEYEKTKDTEKKEADEIKRMTNDIVEVVDAVYEEITENLGWGRDELSYETTEYYDEDEGEMVEVDDIDLEQSYQQFYDNLMELHDEAHKFQQGIYDRLNGEEEYRTWFTRMENLIDWTTYPLTEDIGGYLDDWVTNDMQIIQRTFINKLNTVEQWGKWENAHDDVAQLESELEDIRKKQGVLRGEYDATLGKLTS